MKILLIAVSLVSFSVHAKDVKDFNQVLIEKVQTDIEKDNVHAFEKKGAGRAPASINGNEPETKHLKETPKFDKMNNRQIGPNKW